MIGLFSGCGRIERQSLRVAAGTLLYFNTPGTERLGGAFRLCSIQKDLQGKERRQGQW